MIVIVGRRGQVARALAKAASARALPFVQLGRPELDLEQPERAHAAICAAHPRLVINAAAYVEVDRAESEPERARLINAEAVGALAAAARAVEATFIQISSDYVFGGEGDTPHRESDPVAPRSVYGATKAEGEARAFEANPRTLVVRSSWIYDASGRNFVRTMLRLARTQPEVRVVNDQHGAPTYAADLAGALLDMGAAVIAQDAPYGIYHCTNAGEAHWAAFARAIFTQSALRGGPSATVKEVATAAFPRPAQRPANSRLDCAKIADDFGVRLRRWPDALAACMDEIATGGWSVE